MTKRIDIPFGTHPKNPEWGWGRGRGGRNRRLHVLTNNDPFEYVAPCGTADLAPVEFATGYLCPTCQEVLGLTDADLMVDEEASRL